MTSVEFLINHLTEYGFRLEEHKVEITQAKEMHKQEIIDAFEDSRVLSISNNCNSGKQYYQETFKQD